MGDALIDLERVIASKQPTNQEARILLACKWKALADFTIGACVGSGVVWTATKRILTRWQRVNLSGGAAAVLGLWRFNKSLDSAVDQILALEGSRMQRELANIIVKKYQHYPEKMQLISKHFYLEEIFDDSTTDKAKLQWRFRNFYSDNVAYGQRTSEAATESGSHQPYRDSGSHSNLQNKPHISSSDSPNGYGTEETKLEVKRSIINPGFDLMGDAIDCVFGESTMITGGEIHHPTNAAASPKAPASRSHKRSHRRRRRHREVPLDSADA